jgi:NTP pyrophosphatase (non-canonical NTP hydrolase)
MKFSEYQEKSRVTALYPDKDNNFIYPTLGLVGESGEIAEKIKKVLRDDSGKLSNEKKQEIGKELGDVLWYISQLTTELGMNLDEIAEGNIKKLYSRLDRGVIGGSGDNR